MYKLIPFLQKSLHRKQDPLLKFFSTACFSKDPMIPVSKAYSLLSSKSSLFIDIRDPLAYKESHIPGAINMNEFFTYLGTSDEKGVKHLTSHFEALFQKAGITGQENIITYEECLKTRFGASCRAYFLLNLFGHKNVNVLHGGFEAWVKANYPVTQEVPSVKANPSFQAKWNDQYYAGKDHVLKAMQGKNQKTVLLDVRDIEEWNAETSSPYGKDFAPRKGRIPGAVHIVWKDLLEIKDGVTFMKTPEEVKKVCQEKGIQKDQEIIVYCFKGARASNSLIALERAGYTNLKNYFASWNEWSRDNSLSIEGEKP